MNQENIAIIANDKNLPLEEKVKRIEEIEKERAKEKIKEAKLKHPDAPNAMLPFLTEEAKKLAQENLKVHMQDKIEEAKEEAGDPVLIFDTHVELGEHKMNIPNITAILLLKRISDKGNAYDYMGGMYTNFDRMGVIGYVLENQYNKKFTRKTKAEILKNAKIWYNELTLQDKEILYVLIDRALFAVIEQSGSKKKKIFGQESHSSTLIKPQLAS